MTTSKLGAAARNIALWQASLFFILSWLPLVRCLFDGKSYVWGQSYYGVMFRAAGTTGDFGVLILQFAVSLAIVWLGFRRPGRIAYGLMTAWMVFMIGDLFWTFANEPEGLIFHGDTLGVEANVGHAFLGFYGVALLMTIFGAALELKPGGAPGPFRWTGMNSVLLAAALAPLPLQYWLLHDGEPHGRTDEIGVILTMVQWLVVVFAISAGRKTG